MARPRRLRGRRRGDADDAQYASGSGSTAQTSTAVSEGSLTALATASATTGSSTSARSPRSRTRTGTWSDQQGDVSRAPRAAVLVCRDPARALVLDFRDETPAFGNHPRNQEASWCAPRSCFPSLAAAPALAQPAPPAPVAPLPRCAAARRGSALARQHRPRAGPGAPDDRALARERALHARAPGPDHPDRRRACTCSRPTSTVAFASASFPTRECRRADRELGGRRRTRWRSATAGRRRRRCRRPSALFATRVHRAPPMGPPRLRPSGVRARVRRTAAELRLDVVPRARSVRARTTSCPAAAGGRSTRRSYLRSSAGFGANSSGGLRVELELYNQNDWIIGASAGITGSQMNVDDSLRVQLVLRRERHRLHARGHARPASRARATGTCAATSVSAS